MKLFEIFGEIKIDDKNAEKTLTKADKKAGSVAGSFGKMAKTIGAVAIGAKLVSMGKDAIQAGSDFEEMKNKFDVTFKTMGEQAENWAGEWSDSVGRSKVDTMEFLSNIADLQQGLGMTEEESLNLSQKIVQLGTDLASFNNVNDAQAIEAVQKAMLGEAESAKQLGLLLNVDRVKDFAEANGYVWEEVTDAERAMLTYELAVTQSQNAMGDAERSSDSYANQVKALKSTFSDLQSELGAKFIPIVTDVVTFINDKMIPAFIMIYNKLKDNLQPIFEEHIQPIFEKFGKWIKDNMPMIQEISERVFEAIVVALDSVWSFISEYILPIFGSIYDFVEDNFPTIKSIFENVFGAAYDVIEILWGVMKDLWEFVEPTFPLIGEVIETAFGIILTVVEGVSSGFETLIGWIKDAIDWLNVWNDEKSAGIGSDEFAESIDYPGSGGIKSSRAIPEQVKDTRINNGRLAADTSPVNVNTMVVREEADIFKVSRELYNMQISNNRGVAIE